MENKGVEVVIKAKVPGEVAEWLEKMKAFRQKGNVTSKALEFYHDYHFYRKGFFIRLIELHFEEIKHLLRKIGRIRKENEV
ncbi:MAG: hypothetical protein ACTSWD_04760 [Candidatus Heimdallarchaeota archaeon]